MKLTALYLFLIFSSTQLSFAKDVQTILNDKATCDLFKPVEEFETWGVGDYQKLGVIKNTDNYPIHRIFADQIAKHIDAECPTTELSNLLGELVMYTPLLCDGIANKIYAGDKVRIASASKECTFVHSLENRQKYAMLDALKLAKKNSQAECSETLENAISNLRRATKDIIKTPPSDVGRKTGEARPK